MKRFFTTCIALVLLIAAALPASAASGEDCLTLAVAIRGKDVITVAPAVVCNNGGNCTVITDASVYVNGADKYLVILGGQEVEISYLDEFSEELATFKADASYLSQPEVLDIAQSVQLGEELIYYFYYIDEDGLVILESSARIIEENGTQRFKPTLPDGVDKAAIIYPAIAVSRAGELAILKTEQDVIPLASIEGSGGATAPTPDDPGLSIETVVGIVAVAAAAVAGVVFFCKRSGSSSSGTPAKPITSTQPMNPVQSAPSVPDIPERIEPVEIKPQPKVKTSVLYLCCEGGALDGRRYPVGTTTLLIGRDPSCNIRYPADTKGVSRRHCEIFWKNGVLHIMDLGSTSGTFIRGKGQIAANAPVAVNAGDTFYLGEKRNAFVIRMGDEG